MEDRCVALRCVALRALRVRVRVQIAMFIRYGKFEFATVPL